MSGCDKDRMISKRVLVVEDFEDSRTGLSKLLESEGYEVLQAADGAQAIDLALDRNPDIILMDLTLPLIDGLTATKKIKETKSMSAVPVIALTAHDLEEVKGMVDSAGCADFVTKPVNFSTLLALISKYLSE
jgi:two-component system cell cycle response regulator DivK